MEAEACDYTNRISLKMARSGKGQFEEEDCLFHIHTLLIYMH